MSSAFSWRAVGAALILIGLAQMALGWVARGEINALKLTYMPSDCHDGHDPDTCPVLRNNVDWYIAAGWGCSALLILGGAYMAIRPPEAEQRQRAVQAQNRQLLSRITRLADDRERDDRFEILLQGLKEDEQAVLRAVRQQDGIKQNTLAIRTSLSKSKLSVLLVDMEKRGLVKKVPEGKTNRIHMKKPF